MAVNYVTVKGYVRDGKLEVELPENVTEGEVEIIVPVAVEEDDLTPEELQEYLNFKGLSFGEIETGGWEDRGIEDSVAWVEEQKRKRRERHKWQQG